MTTGQLLFTDDISSARQEIEAAGGRITHRFSDHAFVAALPEGADPEGLDTASLDEPDDLDQVTRILVGSWRDREAGAPSAQATRTNRLKWDTAGYESPLEMDTEVEDGAPTLDGVEAQSTGTPTSRYLIGSVAVGVVIVSGPTDELTFTDAQHTKLLAEVQEGLDFLANAEPRANVSFVYDVHFESVDVDPGPTTSYESAEGPWRNAALANMGFPASRDGSIKYVQDLRTAKGTDWAYVVYFTKYPLKHFAYASFERTTMHWGNDGWGVDNINRVFAHESCHIFGAADEYGSCGCDSVHGHLAVPNGNCHNCDGRVQEPCLMDANELSLCDFSRRQLGWDESMFPGDTTSLHGRRTLKQKSSDRFLDAHESSGSDFNVVTRPAQDNNTQRWLMSQVGQVCTLRQRSSDRYMDAHENSEKDYSVVTRTEQANDTQRWVLLSVPDALSTYTVQQLSNGRYLDAHTTSAADFDVVTRAAQHNDSQRWRFNPVGGDDYTIGHVVNDRLLDAHEGSGQDFSIVTRTAQQNDSQIWTVSQVAGVYTLQQLSNGRLLDAHQNSDRDHSVVTRVTQQNDTQLWVVTALGDARYTLQQLSSGRFLDAHESSGQDFSVVTRTRQNNDTQRWIIEPA